ncbi:MAG: hypothetical protein A2W22_00250 [Candidatus Levybacteria bacterium RBG_16_35_11]|nr:MAG: hypothetical protein A2W22_00250 [Candidatus Levybacteria bacterium RBG_16_35_11]
MLISLWGHLGYFLKDFYLYLLTILIAFLVCVFLLLKISKSTVSENKKGFYVLIIFTFFFIILIYSAFEGYFRYSFDVSDSLGFLKVSHKWDQRHVIYNNYQYRDKDFAVQKEEGTVRIGVMGDSMAFGYGIKDTNNRFSNLLEEKLLKDGYNAEVYNFGVPGFDTEQEVQEYERVKRFNFDILIWSYFLNDAEEASRSAGEAILQNEQRKQTSPIIEFVLNNSFFFDYVYWRINAKYGRVFEGMGKADLSQYNNPEIFNHHYDLISSFNKELTGEGKKVVAIIFPFLYFLPDYPKDAINIHKKMANTFLDSGVSKVVDLLPELKGKNPNQLTVSRFDYHPNEYVHRLATNLLYNSIAPLLERKGDKTYLIKDEE